MKNNEANANQQLSGGRRKSMLFESHDNTIENSASQIHKEFKSSKNQINVASSTEIENKKIFYNANEPDENFLSRQQPENQINNIAAAFKRNSIYLSANFPSFNLQISTINSPTNNCINNSITKFTSNFGNTEVDLDFTNKVTNKGGLEQSEFSNLLKLNTALNKYLIGSNSTRQKKAIGITNNIKSFQSRNANNSIFNFENKSNKYFSNSTARSPNNENRNSDYNNLQKNNEQNATKRNHVNFYTNKKPTKKKKNEIKKNSKTQITETEINPTINLDNYSSVLTQTMLNYRKESNPNQNNPNFLNNSNNITLAFPSFNRTLNTKSFKNNNTIYGENALIKIDIREKDFSNPQDSNKIINANKHIYDNINTSLINIQKIYYDKTIFGIEKFHHELKKNRGKVRISSILPKNWDNAKNINPNEIIPDVAEEKQQINNINNSKRNQKAGSDVISLCSDTELNHQEKIPNEKDKEKEEINLALESEKSTSKKHNIEAGGKFKNRILRSLDNNELYAFYKYSTKNFPEGREQFAFDFSFGDLVLFGGIVTNKNNHVWTLDPSNLN